MLKGHRVPENVHLRVRFGLGVHALLGKLFYLQRRHVRRRSRAARDALEVFPGLRLDVIRLKISHEDERDILRRIIDPVKLVRLRFGNRRDVRRPAYDRPGVRTRFPEHAR